MPGAEKIVLLRLGSADAQAYVADLPDTGAIPSLIFDGPITLRVKDERKPYGIVAGAPVYDYQTDEIVWPCVAPRDSSGSLPTQVWRIGPHFLPAFTEVTPLVLAQPSGTILQNGVLTLSTMAGAFEGDSTVTLVRRSKEGKWSKLPVASTEPRADSSFSVVYKPTRDELEYVYTMRVKGTDWGTLWVNQLRTSYFDKLVTNDASTLWTSYKADGFALTTGFTPIVLTSPKSGESRLYIFVGSASQNWIQYSYIPLLKDGSVNSNMTSTALKNQRFSITGSPKAQKLKVIENKGRLIVLWDKCMGDGPSDQIIAYYGTIGDDGLAPEENQWKEIKVGFKDVQSWKSGTNFSYSAVVVPSNYV